ncbi:MAG: hypothetical protein JWM39_791 [Parcubacteria group bacterium]|nr:hypothetical protein [Parcubacteria group bacterium]
MHFATKLGAMFLAPFMTFSGMAHMPPTNLYQAPNQPVTVGSAPQISSVVGPTSLALDQNGSWTVNVKEIGDQNLHYSVIWGDENSALRRNALISPVATTSATFTHAYSTKGTYQPTFTVTDDSGHSVSKNAAKVQVGTNNVVASITSITPGTGLAGTAVTLVGSGFASSSVVHFGTTTVSAAIQDANDISFTVPSTTPAGTYKVWVKGNDSNKGKSNVVSFTVTAPIKAHLSVNGIDAPVTLVAGTDGTWTVHASSNVSGNLHYSVVWGDENMMLRALAVVMPQTTQTSATFTHAYDAAGSYQPTFTITDDAGDTTSTSASVQVTAQ